MICTTRGGARSELLVILSPLVDDGSSRRPAVGHRACVKGRPSDAAKQLKGARARGICDAICYCGQCTRTVCTSPPWRQRTSSTPLNPTGFDLGGVAIPVFALCCCLPGGRSVLLWLVDQYDEIELIILDLVEYFVF